MPARENNSKKTHAVNSWLNLILSVFIVVCVFTTIVINLLSQATEIVEEVGLKTFRMYTVLSNMFVGITAAMSIPFAVDGIRYKNYHLPRWVINLTFSSTICIALTFVIALCVLSPQAGFKYIMLRRSNLLSHTFVPVTAIISFLFINTYHTIKFKTTFYAILPMLLYAIVYLVCAILIGEENGGWRDHYHFEDLMPWYYIFILMILLTYGIAVLLRYVHNRMHKRDKAFTESYYQNADEYKLPSIEDAIRALARENKLYDVGGEIVVPRRIIKFLEKKYSSNLPLTDLCSIYIDEYLK